MDGNYSGGFDLEDDAMRGYHPPKRNQDQEIEKEAKLLGTQLKGPTRSLRRTTTTLYTELHKKASWELKRVARYPFNTARALMTACFKRNSGRSVTANDRKDNEGSRNVHWQRESDKNFERSFRSRKSRKQNMLTEWRHRDTSPTHEVEESSNSSNSRKGGRFKRIEIHLWSPKSSRKSSKSAATGSHDVRKLSADQRLDCTYLAGEASRVITPQLSPKLTSKTTGELAKPSKTENHLRKRVSTLPARTDSSYAAGEAARIATPLESPQFSTPFEAPISPNSTPFRVKEMSYFQFPIQKTDEASCYAGGEANRVPTPTSTIIYPPELSPDSHPGLRRHTTVPEVLPSYFDFELKRPPLRRASSASQSTSRKSEDFTIFPLEPFHDNDSKNADGRTINRPQTHPLPHFLAAPKISRVAPFAVKKDYFSTFHRYNSQSQSPNTPPTTSVAASRGLPGIRFLTKPLGYSTSGTSSSSSGGSILMDGKLSSRRRSSARSQSRRASLKEEILEYHRQSFLASVDEHRPSLARHETTSTRRSSYPKSVSDHADGRVVSWRGVLVTEEESKILDLFVGVRRRESRSLSPEKVIRLSPTSPPKASLTKQKIEDPRRHSDDMRFVPSYRKSMILSTASVGWMAEDISPRKNSANTVGSSKSAPFSSDDYDDEKDLKAMYAEAAQETSCLPIGARYRRKSFNQNQEEDYDSHFGKDGNSQVERSAALKLLEQNFHWHTSLHDGEELAAFNAESSPDFQPEWMSTSLLYGNMLKQMPAVTKEPSSKKRESIEMMRLRKERAPSLPLLHRSTDVSFITSVLDSENHAYSDFEVEQKKRRISTKDRIRKLSSAATRRRTSIYVWLEETLKATREKSWSDFLDDTEPSSPPRERQFRSNSFGYDGPSDETEAMIYKQQSDDTNRGQRTSERLPSQQQQQQQQQQQHIRWADSIESKPKGIVYRGIGSAFADSRNHLEEAINSQQADEPILGFHELFSDDCETIDDLSPKTTTTVLGGGPGSFHSLQITTVDITMPPKGTSCAPARNSRTSQKKAFSILGIDSASLEEKEAILKMQRNLVRPNENRKRLDKAVLAPG